MARRFGDKAYSPEEIEFVRNNYKFMSDEKMGIELNCNWYRVTSIRKQFNWSRYCYSTTDNKTRAFICELFISETPLKEIAGIVGKSKVNVSLVIEKYLGVKKSNETKIITLQSKINYEN